MLFRFSTEHILLKAVYIRLIIYIQRQTKQFRKIAVNEQKYFKSAFQHVYGTKNNLIDMRHWKFKHLFAMKNCSNNFIFSGGNTGITASNFL